MSRRREFLVTGPASRAHVVGWLNRLDLERYPDGIDVRVAVHEERHSDAQRRHLNAAIDDIAGAVKWGDPPESLDRETWRALLVTEALGGRLLPGISGGLVLISRSSRDLRVRAMADVIECAYAFGAERGVRFRHPGDRATR